MSRILVAVLGIALITGCATSAEPTVVAVAPESTELDAGSLVEQQHRTRMEVKECVFELVAAGNSHVLDATKACTHIFGVRNINGARTSDLED
jgi:hypothetical protein